MQSKNNNRLYCPKDPAIVKVYRIDPEIKKLVDHWVKTILDNRISTVDFEIACKAALYFVHNAGNVETWKRLKDN